MMKEALCANGVLQTESCFPGGVFTNQILNFKFQFQQNPDVSHEATKYTKKNLVAYWLCGIFSV
jgi:hypothetical protein